MLAIVVLTEAERRYVGMADEDLADHVCRIGGEDDRFLVVQRIPDLPDVFIQVWHEAEGDYLLQHRDGTPDQLFQVRLDDPQLVAAAMVGWARVEHGWDDALGWESLDLAVPDPPAALELSEEEHKLLQDRVREVIVGGYATRAELAEIAQEYLVSGDYRPVSREQAMALVDQMWLDRVREQAAWLGETDPERLSRAFFVLEEAGIATRENFTCCHACGQAEIGAEASSGARGFVYFHSQCTDSAAAGYGLTLYYGGFDGSPLTTAVIGREVVAALGQVGLSVDWNGDPEQAIDVTPLDWRKRLVG